MRSKTPATRVPGSCLTQWTDCPIHAEPVQEVVVLERLDTTLVVTAQPPEAFVTFNLGLVGLAALMVALNVGGQPAENAILARYTPLAWRGRIYGLKFVATLGISTLGVALVPAIHNWTGSLDTLLLVIGGIAVVSAIAASQLPRDRDAALAGRVGPLPAGEGD